MGIPKYLEDTIKSIVRCCTAPIQALLVPNTPAFVLRRPNEEPFILGGPNNDQATVGMADYALDGEVIYTGKQFDGTDVFEARFEKPLNTTGGTTALVIPPSFGGIDVLLEASLVFIDVSASRQYFLNGTIDTVCDATIAVNTTTGDLTLYWNTAHTGDSIYIIVRFTPNVIP